MLSLEMISLSENHKVTERVQLIRVEKDKDAFHSKAATVKQCV